MSRRRALGTVAAVGLLAVLVAALGFILRAAVDMEAAEREARQLAAHEERVRLALWRLDGVLSGFLAYENVRPVGSVAPPEGEDGFVARRFEIEPGEADPSLPTFDELRTELAKVDGEMPAFELPPPAPGTPEPKELIDFETSNQALANTAEFSQRQSFAGQQSQFIQPLIQPPELARSQTAAAMSRPRTGLLRPLWQELDAGPALLLVRRVERDDEESLQGLELDLEAAREQLLDEIEDLLPSATLEPVLDPATADPARQLALLPLRLEPGAPQPLPAAPGWSAGRLSLTVAVAAVALATLAGGLLLLTAFRLARRRADFASAVIHELRTPLTTFRFYTDMLAEGMVADEDRTSYAETLRREADRLGHLVENVLAYARLERRGRMSSDDVARPVDFASWSSDAANRLRDLAESEGFSFSWHDAPVPDGLLLTADPLAVERILYNLCDNSCKYGRGEEARIEVQVETSQTEPSQVTVRWRDFGPGLDDDARRGLFRAFQRGGVEGTTGIGLGLSLSRRLARDFGGDLRSLPADGPGSVFELTLPSEPADGRES